MAEIKVLHTSTTEVPDEKGKLQPYTYVVFQDETGQIGTVTIPKKAPTDPEIAAAIREQRKAAAERKPRTITL